MNLVNRETVNRLANYRKVLIKFKTLGLGRVFSDNLADALGVSAAQVRKDFSWFGLTGNKKGGYQVDWLIERLNEILGKNQEQKIIIVGCGKLGNALIGHNRFVREGIKVVAGFDTDPAIVNPEGRMPIYDLEVLPDFVAREKIRVAIMTVPEGAASHVVGILLASGIRGVLNFTAMQLKGSDECIVHNVNLALEIENLFYFAEKSICSNQPPGNSDRAADNLNLGLNIKG